MFEIAGNRSLLERNAATLHSGYWISIYRYSLVDIFRRLQVCVCDVCVCVVSCRCIASICKYCTSEYINKFNQMQEDVMQLAVRRNGTYRGNDDYTVVAVFKQLRCNNSQTNIKMPKDTPSMQKASHGNSEWIVSCLTLDLPIFQFRLQFKGWLPVVEHTCWRKAVINFKLTGAEREIFLLDHLISKFVIGQTGIRHGILPCQMWNSFVLFGGRRNLLPLNSIKVFVRLFESCQSPWPTTVLTHQSQPSLLEGLDIDQRLVLKWWLHDPPVQHLPPVVIGSQ